MIPVGEPDPGTVAQAVESFLSARAAAKPSPHTLAAYRRDLAGILAIVAARAGCDAAEVTVGELAPRVLRDAFGTFAATHAKASISRAWSTWNQLFGFLVADGYLDGNPMAAVPKAHHASTGPKPLTGSDTPERLLASAALPRTNARNPWPQRDLAVLATLLLTGLRSAELLSLKVSSITGNPGERRIRVTGKGGKSRSVPIEEPLHQVITTYLDSRRERFPTKRIGARSVLFVDHHGQPLQRGGLQYLVETSLRAAGLGDHRSPGALVHAMRHTYATTLAENGATARELMTLLGHASMTTSQNYIDATAVEQRRAAAANPTYRSLDSLTNTAQSS
ncbi:tyrosine-type recombinase/integrase [Leekyejoonella antrihumi]|uniref:Integrase n=1 Tax=Leekyejoonella antrihumi TaxID=1660198 RepID=A0A563DRW0_9MICO|nr:tyrosine-type recombinase/integrase [Leekyejoonella antrihumi]TWP32980.1 integrase [Leekyejoonella antrihumi]